MSVSGDNISYPSPSPTYSNIRKRTTKTLSGVSVNVKSGRG